MHARTHARTSFCRMQTLSNVYDFFDICSNQNTVEQLIWQQIPMSGNWGSNSHLAKTFSSKFNSDLILSDNRSTCLYLQVEKGADLIQFANIVGIVILKKLVGNIITVAFQKGAKSL